MASNIKVLIVGAGIGGLTLGILLERANINYEILEKHSHHSTVGSAICLVPSVQPLFRQLGILEEIQRLSKPFGSMAFRDDKLECIGTYSSRTPLDIKERYGEYCLIIARRDFCGILSAHVPQSKIHYNKRVLEIRQNVGEVIVQCSDRSTHHCDILVGADGAYSAVRQCLHQELSARGLLPKQDLMPMGYQYDCLVGVTEPLDPHLIPSLTDKFSDFQTVLSKDSTCSYWCIPLTENRISWMVVKYHDRGKKYAEEQIFKISDWGTDAAEAMSYEYRQLKTIYGCELGYLFDKTSKESMAKVMLEEKYYKTWYSGRVVLTGDACHKVVPFGGQGANQSILDMLTLANLLVELQDNTVPEIEQVFAAYFKERASIGRSIVQMSSRLGHIMNRKSWLNDIVRKVALRIQPRWISQIVNDRMSYDRPQATFLPFVEIGGVYRPRPQTRSSYDPATRSFTRRSSVDTEGEMRIQTI
ncbi:hypothetical protein BGW38_004941 [Lunasporangiospora selenospora]|uniref:FAD-binding domain-containing protein n=1 Tax=Lunasporangiospora selenospora TaxID=979761 RepID=A0A9P6G106_9FUNG|nr:hypothetical protein BGW38_004941 [Lunasporangiospora selenospora]